MIRDIEFHTDPRSGEAMYKIGRGDVKELTPSDKDIIRMVLDESERFYPEQSLALEQLYSKSSPNRPFYDFVRARRIINCCFGTNDYQPDVDKHGRFHHELVSCPIIGECRYFKQICQPRFKLCLSKREMEIMELYFSGLETLAIAIRLDLSEHTVNNHRKNSLRKTGFGSLTEFISAAHRYRFFNPG